jgi:hypothetical protein
MLGSTLISAHAGYSMAAVGASFGEKVSNEVVTAGWAVPAPVEHASPKMGAVKTVAFSASTTDPELEPVAQKLEQIGNDSSLPGNIGQLLGLSSGDPVAIKSKAVKTDARSRSIGVVKSNGIAYIVILDRTKQSGNLYMASLDGKMARGYVLTANNPPQPLPQPTSDFNDQKTYWKTQLANTSVASLSSGS